MVSRGFSPQNWVRYLESRLRLSLSLLCIKSFNLDREISFVGLITVASDALGLSGDALGLETDFFVVDWLISLEI